MKRNILVLVVVLLTLGVMIWAGVLNYRRREQERAKLRQLQAMIAQTEPSGGASAEGEEGDNSVIDMNPLQGKMAPGFTLTDTKGQKVSLSDFRGKAVVLDFWATWCAPCKIEIPWLVQFNGEYAGKGLQIIGVSEDDLDLENKAELAKEKQDITDKAAQMKINYPVLFDDTNISTPYGGIDGLPTTFFINREGKVVASTVGLVPREEMEANIKKALSSGGQS